MATTETETGMAAEIMAAVLVAAILVATLAAQTGDHPLVEALAGLTAVAMAVLLVVHLVAVMVAVAIQGMKTAFRGKNSAK